MDQSMANRYCAAVRSNRAFTLAMARHHPERLPMSLRKVKDQGRQEQPKDAAPPRRRDGVAAARRRKVVKLIAEKKTAQEIAQRLGITGARVYQIASEEGMTVARPKFARSEGAQCPNIST